jgi:hypothetical protein
MGNGILLLAFLAVAAGAHAGPLDYLYRVENIKKLTIADRNFYPHFR